MSEGPGGRSSASAEVRPWRVGLLLVGATALVSGVSTFVNLYAVGGTSSAAFVTVRNAAVAAALLPVAWLAVRWTTPFALRSSDWARLVAIGVIGGGIPFLLFFQGLQLAAASGAGLTASFLYRTLFLVAAVLGIVVLKERFHWGLAVGGGLLLLGNLLLLAWTSPVWADGDGYVMAATSLWAIEYTLSRRTLRDLPSGVVAFARMGIGAVVLLGYLLATSQVGAVARFSSAEWTWVGISAALLTGFVVAWYAGLKEVPVSTATAVLVLGFPITWLLQVALRGAALGETEAVGAAAIVLGVALSIGGASVARARTRLPSASAPRAAS